MHASSRPHLRTRTRAHLGLATVLMLVGILNAAAEAAEGPRIGNCSVFPADNIWNARIGGLPVHPRSGDYVASIGADAPLHPDFGSGVWPPGSSSPMGIPFDIVSAAQPPVPISFRWPDESDPGPYPIPPGAQIEGGPLSDGDRHVLVLDRDSCTLYELYYAFPRDDGARWEADSGAVFDLSSNQLRPAGWTSADAAGLPILPGLVRFDEAASGSINHAIRFTAPRTQRAYVWPARHFASSLTSPVNPPMGIRFRLRADFPLAGFDPIVQTILRALQQYGMILSDNGSSWFLSGAPDDRWDNEVLRQLRQVKGSDLEAVDTGGLMVDPDSAATVPAERLVYPQLALGEGLAGILMLSHRGSSSWQGTARLSGGNWPVSLPWSLNQADRTGQSSFEIGLDPGATERFLLESTGPLHSGWLEVEAGPNADLKDLAAAFFIQFRSGGDLIDSTGISPAPFASSSRFPVERTPTTGTGVAVRLAREDLLFSLRDSQGQLLEQISMFLDGALFFDEIFAGMPQEFMGSVVVESASPFCLTVLRQDVTSLEPLKFQLTSIPATSNE